MAKVLLIGAACLPACMAGMCGRCGCAHAVWGLGTGCLLCLRVLSHCGVHSWRTTSCVRVEACACAVDVEGSDVEGLDVEGLDVEGLDVEGSDVEE